MARIRRKPTEYVVRPGKLAAPIERKRDRRKLALPAAAVAAAGIGLGYGIYRLMAPEDPSQPPIAVPPEIPPTPFTPTPTPIPTPTPTPTPREERPFREEGELPEELGWYEFEYQLPKDQWQSGQVIGWKAKSVFRESPQEWSNRIYQDMSGKTDKITYTAEGKPKLERRGGLVWFGEAPSGAKDAVLAPMEFKSSWDKYGTVTKPDEKYNMIVADKMAEGMSKAEAQNFANRYILFSMTATDYSARQVKFVTPEEVAGMKTEADQNKFFKDVLGTSTTHPSGDLGTVVTRAQQGHQHLDQYLYVYTKSYSETHGNLPEGTVPKDFIDYLNKNLGYNIPEGASWSDVHKALEANPKVADTYKGPVPTPPPITTGQAVSKFVESQEGKLMSYQTEAGYAYITYTDKEGTRRTVRREVEDLKAAAKEPTPVKPEPTPRITREEAKEAEAKARAEAITRAERERAVEKKLEREVKVTPAKTEVGIGRVAKEPSKVAETAAVKAAEARKAAEEREAKKKEEEAKKKEAAKPAATKAGVGRAAREAREAPYRTGR